jgi:cytochrome c oxidase subunit II
MPSLTKNLTGSINRNSHRLRVRPAINWAAKGPLALAVVLYSIGGAGAGNEARAADTQLSKDELMAKGEEVYNSTCSGCHQSNGMGLPGSYPPLVEGAAFSAAANVTQPLVERGALKNGKIQLAPLETHLDIVINGIPNSRMFAFGTQIDDAEIAAVVTYERNAWGNDSGDVVQAAQVKAAR